MTPGLADAFSRVGEQEKLPLMVVLAPQVDLDGVHDRFFRGREVPLAETYGVYRDTLAAASHQAFQSIQSSLDILERNGMIANVQPLWIGNLFTVNATRAGAELIANFETVLDVGLDEMISLLEPVETHSAAGEMLATESALNDMNAPAAWATGALGDGSIVGVVGQPFGPIQPALAERSVGAELLIASTYCDQAAQLMLGCAVGCDKQKGDTIGVAPNAHYRLMSLTCGAEPKVSDVLRAIERSLGSTGEDTPDVILQAWETGDSCSSALPEGAWRAFANVEQLGSILVWAAGDHGELGRGSIALPAARAEQNQTFFSVGAVTQNGATSDPQSSRGPSPCDRKSIKPELTAIGGLSRSVSNNGYVNARGSVVAAGYVAGTLALMRQVNPELSAQAAKIALELSARDLGVTGEDHEFGFGLLDVAAAVEHAAASSKTGTISGAIRYGGEYLPGARVFLVSAEGSYVATTNAEGKFRFFQIPENRSFALYAARFGYQDYIAPDSVSVGMRQEKSVTIQLEGGIADDAEVDRGFVLGVPGDDAIAGVWTRAVPVPSSESGQPVQVGEDATSYGSLCFVTGNGASPDEPAASHDVDGGRTTLRSPMFRLGNLSDSKLTFSYAYSNDRGPQKGGDFFRAQISNDGGATWTNLVQTSVSTNGWQKVELKLEDFIEPTDQMILQFVAEDFAPPSLVEAAVDDVHIDGKKEAPEPPKNLALTPTETGVQLTWGSSEGASAYNVYMSGNQAHVYGSENLFKVVSDTALFVPFDQIPYERFYFQVTAVK